MAGFAPAQKLYGVSIMRPKKYYPVFSNGHVIAIAHGLREAREYGMYSHCSLFSFVTRLAAEEYSAWHNYQRENAEPLRVKRAKEISRAISQKYQAAMRSRATLF